MTAVADGKAVDHSMGLTPLEGLVMGTRSGDIDPADHLLHAERRLQLRPGGQGPEQGKRPAGRLAASATTCATAWPPPTAATTSAKLAVEMFVYRIIKYIGAVLHRSCRPGRGGAYRRHRRELRAHPPGLSGPQRLGVELDEQANQATTRGKAGAITTPGSPAAGLGRADQRRTHDRPRHPQDRLGRPRARPTPLRLNAHHDRIARPCVGIPAYGHSHFIQLFG